MRKSPLDRSQVTAANTSPRNVNSHSRGTKHTQPKGVSKRLRRGTAASLHAEDLRHEGYWGRKDVPDA